MSQTLDGTRQLCKEGEKKLLNNQFFAYTSACTDKIRQHFYINSSFLSCLYFSCTNYVLEVSSAPER